MSLADDLDGIRNQKRRPAPCKTGAWLAEMDEESRAAFEAYVADGLERRAAWKVALRYGCDASETRFRVHCDRSCSCFIGAEVAA